MKRHEEFIKRFKTYKNNEEYSVIGKYINTKTKLKFLHHKCGKTFNMTPNNFQRGQRCPHCSKYRRLTHSEVYEEVKKLSNGEYELISEFKKAKEKIKLKHHKCGNIIEILIGDFRRGFGCAYCAGNKKINYKDYNHLVKKIDNNYKFIYNDKDYKNYKNVHSKIKLYHEKCDNYFYMSYNNFRNGQRCPYCNNINNESKNIRIIKEYLEDNNIEYKIEYTLEDLINPKTNRNLRFDFYIPLYDFFIEYDGEQHFIYNENGFFTKDVVKEIQYRDSLKDKYCKDNNIKLYRINYMQDVKEELRKIFNNYSSTTIETTH